MRRPTLGLILRRISQLALCIMVAKPCVGSANPRTVELLNKAYVALLSSERSDRNNQEKMAITLARANAICAFELAPHNSWRANGEWKVIKSEIESLPPYIPEPEPTGCLGVVKKHKVFERVTCIRHQDPTLTDISRDMELIRKGQIELIRPLSLIRAQSENRVQRLRPIPADGSLGTLLIQNKNLRSHERAQAKENP